MKIKLWPYFREILVALVGGFIGAILSLVGTENLSWNVAWVLIIFYSLIIMIVVFVLDEVLNYKK